MKNDIPLEQQNMPGSNEISRRQMIANLGLLAGTSTIGLSGLTTLASAQTNPQSKNIFSLEGKSAIVTGAARGIGRAICVALANAGVDIMGIDIAAPASPDVIYPAATKDDLEETRKMVEELNRRFISVVADTRDVGAIRSAADQAQKEFGKIDILVADAGIQVYASVADMTDRQWKDVIDVNLTGTANTVRAVINHMIPRNYGRIILIASGQGRHGFADGSAYSASKWGIIGFMKSVALEVGKNGITVNTVEPGLIDTDMTRNPGRWNEALKAAGKEPENPPKEEDVIAAVVPTSVMKIPWMKAEDVAPAVVFLATDAAYRVSGSTYDATGGESAKYTA